MERTYPASVDDINTHLSNISTRVFGNRFMPDQTLYEYLIEFLLVFVSSKSHGTENGKLKFHSNSDDRLYYYIEPKIGLRRFIFYDKSKKNSIIKIDEEAYKEIEKILLDRIDCEDGNDILNAIQDLLHGYAVVVKKRSWCAQSLLPLCPEMVFCDAMPKDKDRKKLKWSDDNAKVDTTFDFNKRNFLARGGEVYYLHLLQSLEDDGDKKSKLETLLSDLMRVESKRLSVICYFIQDSWEHSRNFSKDKLTQTMSLSFIPEDAYYECGKYSVDELINYLSNELPLINKIEILAKGVMFQIMRMLSWRVDNYLDSKKTNWIVDMKGDSSDSIKKIAAENFREIDNRFMSVLNKSAGEINIPEEEYMKKLSKAKRSSLDVFRTKGKELQCIIPTNGPFERFSLSEDIIKFLVLSLIPPKKKMTLDMFLQKMYEHYRIVIGPEEFRKSIKDGSKFDASLSNAFIDNQNAFQKFLKATGFLKELSDATSIVVNPYNAYRGEIR